MVDLKHTQRLLEAHVPSDATEAQHLERMQALLAKGVVAFDRERHAPGHFTASAFVVSPRGREALLIHHDKLGLWLQPGGHFEAIDGDPEGAARRELAEETGLSAVEPLGTGLLDVDIHLIPARPDAPAHEHFDLRFAFVAASRAVRAGSGVRAARWVPLDELVATATDASVRRAAQRLRQLR